MKKAWGILGGLCFLNVLAWIGVWQLHQVGLEVTFFDVGQGDAAFIETPQNQQILIDGGPDDKVLEKLGKEMPFWDRTLDLVVLTHPDFDHLAGLIEVLKRYQVENILWTGIVCDTGLCQEWQKLIKEEGANVYIAKAGLRISDLEVLFPFESLEGKKASNNNDTSIVLRLASNKKSFLFAGDISQSIEKKLTNVDSDVLKIGHHGSKYSSSKEFIKAVSPEVAVISVGKDNKYGHPHQETLDTLNEYGISILRTDINSDIKIK